MSLGGVNPILELLTSPPPLKGKVKVLMLLLDRCYILGGSEHNTPKYTHNRCRKISLPTPYLPKNRA